MKKFELDMHALSVETRVWVDAAEEIEIRLKEIGAQFEDEFRLSDEVYADLSEVSLDNHSFDSKRAAARIRVFFRDSKPVFIALVKEAPDEVPGNLNLHDVTRVTLCEYELDGEKSRLENLLAERGFPDLFKKISKIRRVFSFNDSLIFLDDIEDFTTALEVRTEISELAEAEETKNKQLAFINELGIPSEDVIEKSYTHLILDKHVRSNPKLRLAHLKRELERLKRKRDKLLLRSNEHYREGGDGWHDNASWTILMERIEVLDVKVSKLREEIFEVRRK